MTTKSSGLTFVAVYLNRHGYIYAHQVFGQFLKLTKDGDSNKILEADFKDWLKYKGKVNENNARLCFNAFVDWTNQHM